MKTTFGVYFSADPHHRKSRNCMSLALYIVLINLCAALALVTLESNLIEANIIKQIEEARYI